MPDQTLPKGPFEFSAKELKEWDTIKGEDDRFDNWNKCELFYKVKPYSEPANTVNIYIDTIELLLKEGPEALACTIEQLGESIKKDKSEFKTNPDYLVKVGDYWLNKNVSNNTKFRNLQKIFKGLDDEITNKYSFRLSERNLKDNNYFTMTIKLVSKEAEFFECVESTDKEFQHPVTQETINAYLKNYFDYKAVLENEHYAKFIGCNKKEEFYSKSRTIDAGRQLVKLVLEKYESRITGLSDAERESIITNSAGSTDSAGIFFNKARCYENTYCSKGREPCEYTGSEHPFYVACEGCFGGIRLAYELLKRFGDVDDCFQIFYKHDKEPPNKSSNNEYNPNIIYYGPPGTGKTRRAKIKAIELVAGKSVNGKSDEVKLKLADDCLDKKGTDYDGQIRLVQFHPSYSYNDFIETIDVNGGYKDKVFKEFANEAGKHKNKAYVLIIDEINRANTAEVLGELLFGLEYRNTEFSTSLSSMQKHEEFSVPDNLYVIGTMNTADRSLQNLDYAVRRRFKFDRIDSTAPDPIEGTVDGHYYKISSGKFFLKDIYTIVKDDVENSVARGIDPNDILPGISYFVANPDETDSEKPDSDHFLYVLQYQLIPLLKEYAKDGMFTNRKILNRVSDIEGFDGFDSKDGPNTLMNMLKKESYQKRLEEVYDKFIKIKVNP